MPLNEILMQDIPALFMLIVGFVLLVIEMYVPGFGAPGIIGSLLLIGGIALWAETAVQALVITLIVVALLCIALSVSIHSISKGRLAKSKLVLKQVSNIPGLGENDLSYFIGHEGITKTVLRPAGMGEFDGVKLNVVSDGEFIQVGAKVRVDHVEGNRIVVSEVEAHEKSARKTTKASHR